MKIREFLAACEVFNRLADIRICQGEWSARQAFLVKRILNQLAPVAESYRKIRDDLMASTGMIEYQKKNHDYIVKNGKLNQSGIYEVKPEDREKYIEFLNTLNEENKEAIESFNTLHNDLLEQDSGISEPVKKLDISDLDNSGLTASDLIKIELFLGA
jgi:hypothetical protein